LVVVDRSVMPTNGWPVGLMAATVPTAVCALIALYCSRTALTSVIWPVGVAETWLSGCLPPHPLVINALMENVAASTAGATRRIHEAELAAVRAETKGRAEGGVVPCRAPAFRLRCMMAPWNERPARRDNGSLGGWMIGSCQNRFVRPDCRRPRLRAE
jgi:hypothetical protein